MAGSTLQGSFANTGPGDRVKRAVSERRLRRRARSVAHGRAGRELADLLSTAAGDGDLGRPLQRLLA
jgi:hypothetical protein